jgi:hypothetical protein
LYFRLLQTDQYCKNSGWEIIGYYQANEGLNDNAPDFVASRIAEKLAEVNPNILVLMVRDFIYFKRNCVGSKMLIWRTLISLFFVYDDFRLTTNC